MFRRIVGTLAVFAATAAVGWPFTNPLDVKLADPSMIRVGDTYYLYGTASRPADANVGIPAWTSTDLVHWRDRGMVWRRDDQTWGQQWFWGPEVRRFGDRWLLFYGGFRKTDGRQQGRICVAAADSPLGPFKDVRAPLFDWPKDVIDAFPFTDADGSCYLYFTETANWHNSIFVVRLAADGLSIDGQPQQILVPDQPWEVEPVNEGPFVWRHDGRYWAMFSVNNFNHKWYGMGLATADSPLGPWHKQTSGPVLRQSADLAGPGCAGLIDSPDGRELWCYYHVHLAADGYPRQLAISRARYEGGTLRIDPPRTAPQAAPSGSPEPTPPVSDRFAEFDATRWTVADEDAASWRVADGALTITAQDGDMWRDRVDYRNLFLQHAAAGDMTLSVTVKAPIAADHEQACLVAWQDDDNYVRLGTVWAGGPKLSAAIELLGTYEERMLPNDLGETLTLRLTRRGDLWSFEARAPGGPWRAVGEPREAALALPRPGLTAMSPGSLRRWEARFTDFLVAR